MKIRKLMKSLAAAFALVCGFFTLAQTGSTISFPEHYRMWVHVKTTVILEATPGKKRTSDGLHHRYERRAA